MSEVWKKLPNNEIDIYIKKAREDGERYKKEKEEFEKKLHTSSETRQDKKTRQDTQTSTRTRTIPQIKLIPPEAPPLPNAKLSLSHNTQQSPHAQIINTNPNQLTQSQSVDSANPCKMECVEGKNTLMENEDIIEIFTDSEASFSLNFSDLQNNPKHRINPHKHNLTFLPQENVQANQGLDKSDDDNILYVNDTLLEEDNSPTSAFNQNQLPNIDSLVNQKEGLSANASQEHEKSEVKEEVNVSKSELQINQILEDDEDSEDSQQFQSIALPKKRTFSKTSRSSSSKSSCSNTSNRDNKLKKTS